MSTALGSELVTIATAGPTIDGIVFDRPSASKTVVAVIDPLRGPVYRTVHPDDVTAREADSPHDGPLRLLIRRTPPPAPAGSRSSAGASRGRTGHTRAATHRTTGR